MVAEEPQPDDEKREVGGRFVFQLSAGETETQMKGCWWCQSEGNQKEIHSTEVNNIGVDGG